MQPSRFAAVVVIGLIITAIVGVFYYFTRTFGGMNDQLKDAMGLFVEAPPPPSWREEQLQSLYVQMAQQQRQARLEAQFAEQGLTFPPRVAALVVYLEERVLEVWAGDGQRLQPVEQYPFCVGTTKRSAREVPDTPDVAAGRHLEIPVGLYRVERFFTKDFIYFLSLRLNWPNAADEARGVKARPGQEMFVRGGCGRDRSIYLRQEGIKEVYLIAMEARTAGQPHIPVYIFPARMTDESTDDLLKKVGRDRRRKTLYKKMKEGYDRLREEGRLLDVSVDPDGNYVFDASGTTGPVAASSPSPGQIPR